MKRMWRRWYVKAAVVVVVVVALLVVWFVALKPTYTADEVLAMLPQCREINLELYQDWEEVGQDQVTRECYQGDWYRLNMNVNWFKTKNKADAHFDQGVYALTRFDWRQYEVWSTSIWNPESNNVTKHATFFRDDIDEHLTKTCVGVVNHIVLAKRDRLVISSSGSGTGVWGSPCLPDDLIDGDAQPALVNRAMDMTIRRTED